MFGKSMSIPDELMLRYFELATPVGFRQVDDLKRGLEEGRYHPRDVKMRLGREIVSIFYDREQAEAVQQEFVRVFQKKGIPDEMPEFCLKDLGLTANPEIVSLLVAVGFAPSRGEARRLLEQGGVRLNDVKLDCLHSDVAVHDGDVLKVGKRKFGRLIL